jgi:hypothetical protein
MRDAKASRFLLDRQRRESEFSTLSVSLFGAAWWIEQLARISHQS